MAVYLIIDNDDIVRIGLISLLKRVSKDPITILEADGVNSGLVQIRNNKIDVVFLDVEMDDGTGFDLLSQLSNYDFQLVIITAHNKYAVDAFKFCAIDFIQKPIDGLDLLDTLQKLEKNKHLKELEKQVDLLQEKLNGSQPMKRIALNDNENIHYVNIDSIIMCESYKSYTTFYLNDSRKIVVSKTLKEYDDLLKEYGFCRVHNSFLINSNKVVRFEKQDGGQIVLENNFFAPVSVRKKDEVLKLLNRN